jgi:acyl carrier protein
MATLTNSEGQTFRIKSDPIDKKTDPGHTISIGAGSFKSLRRIRMATVFERVRDIAADKLSVEPDDIQLESSFTEDLEADSLDVVELIMALEEEFGGDDTPLEISDEDAEGLNTVQDVVEYLGTKGVED